MAGIEPIIDLDSIMEQHQMERTAQNTQVMNVGADGAEPICAHITAEFAQAACAPSQDLTQEQTLEAGAFNM